MEGSYNQDLSLIQEMLSGFLKTKIIDKKQLSKIDTLVRRSEQGQIKVLNSSLPLDIQRIVFGALRNINTTATGMKERLRNAASRHENPTTAEQAMAIMESLCNVASCIEPYMQKGRFLIDLEEISRLSRILYKKAAMFGFSESQQEQLKKAGITAAQVESFIHSFDSSLSRELEIDEEVKSKLEDSC